MEPSPDSAELGVKSDEPPVEPKLKRLVGGGFDGVDELLGAWKLKRGAAFFSVAASPNLMGVPGLKVWSPANVSDFGGAVFAPAALKSKKANGLLVGVKVPLVVPLFSFSDSDPSSSRVMREKRLPFDVVVCFCCLAASSSDSVVLASESPNLRLGGVVGSVDLVTFSPSSSDSSWWLDDAPEDKWPNMLLDGV